MPLKKSIPDSPFWGFGGAGRTRQAVPRMEAGSSFRRCHLNPHVWELPYICLNSHRVLSPASSSGVRVRLCPQPSLRGRGECDSQTLETPLWKFHPPCYSPWGVPGTLQLCHIHSLWKHLLISLQRGAELPSYVHKCFATVLPAVIPDCHEDFKVCPPCWCLQFLISLRAAAIL